MVHSPCSTSPPPCVPCLGPWCHLCSPPALLWDTVGTSSGPKPIPGRIPVTCSAEPQVPARRNWGRTELESPGARGQAAGNALGLRSCRPCQDRWRGKPGTEHLQLLRPSPALAAAKSRGHCYSRGPACARTAPKHVPAPCPSAPEHVSRCQHACAHGDWLRPDLGCPDKVRCVLQGCSVWHRDVGTWGFGDVGTWGRGDVGWSRSVTKRPRIPTALSRFSK